jgi:subtilisin family serine protease
VRRERLDARGEPGGRLAVSHRDGGSTVARRSRRVAAARAIAAGVLFAATGCSGSNARPDAFANAPLLPGVGFGTALLGVITLAEFASHYGPGRSSVSIGDEVLFEFRYADGQYAFAFTATEACRTALAGSLREAASRLRDTAAFARDFPACGTSPLTSVAVAAPADHVAGDWTGLSVAGLKLGSTIAALDAYGPPADVRGLWLAGSDESDGRYDMRTYASGLVAYVGNAPDGPERGKLVVRKFAIFLPDSN